MTIFHLTEPYRKKGWRCPGIGRGRNQLQAGLGLQLGRVLRLLSCCGLGLLAAVNQSRFSAGPLPPASSRLHTDAAEREQLVEPGLKLGILAQIESTSMAKNASRRDWSNLHRSCQTDLFRRKHYDRDMLPSPRQAGLRTASPALLEQLLHPNSQHAGPQSLVWFDGQVLNRGLLAAVGTVGLSDTR